MQVSVFNSCLELSQEQLDKATNWIREHRGTCPHTSPQVAHALGTPFFYTFRFGGLGTEVNVGCNCGKKLSITDATNL